MKRGVIASNMKKITQKNKVLLFLTAIIENL